MTGKSHFVFGLGTGIIAAIASPTPIYSLFYVPIAGIASLLPDIDSNSSIIGRRVKIIGKIFKHRGVIHTPVFMLLFMLIPYNVVRHMFLIGFASHLFLDMFNKGGIMLFWPFSKKKFRIASLKSGAWVESIIVAVLLILEIITLIAFKIF